MRIILIGCVLLSSIVRADPPTTQPDQPGDIRSFELTAVAPPTPALKYQLLFDPIDRHPGNAAIPYMQTAMLITPEIDELQDKASDALEAKDDARFQELGEQLIAKSSTIIDTADLAGRCDHCDWQPAIRERGIAAILPHLNRMRQLANVLYTVAIVQSRNGKIDDAVATLRLGYELAVKGGEEPILISGLVSLGIAGEMNRTAVELMNRPDAPNLYWAMINLPRPLVSMRRSMDGERMFLIGSIPVLEKARTSTELSAEDWKKVVKQMEAMSQQLAGEGATKPPITDFDSAATAILPRARDYYARTRRLSADQIAKLDPLKVSATYFFEQYQSLSDEFYKLLGLPYPQMLPRVHELEERIAKAQEQTPDNLFLRVLPSFWRAVQTYARVDRQLAAMTVVEAIRSYAAAHDKKLPAKLEDIVETPPPLNPRSGQAFEYRVEGDKAIVSDPEPKDYPLEYTIRIR